MENKVALHEGECDLDGQAKEDKKPQGQRLLLGLVLVALVTVIVLLVVLLTKKPEESSVMIDPDSIAARTIGYEDGLTVVNDPDALQQAVDEMYAKLEEGIALEFQNDAFSEDGETFLCYIANSVENAYDMYINIFADSELTDEIFLSRLVPPGSAFDSITLKHPLDPGTHRVYVVYTQVKEEDGEMVINDQTTYTMDFHVEE